MRESSPSEKLKECKKERSMSRERQPNASERESSYEPADGNAKDELVPEKQEQDDEEHTGAPDAGTSRGNIALEAETVSSTMQ